MRVALIACPAWANWAPIPALLVLRAQLRRAGHEVELFDMNIDAYNAADEEFKEWWREDQSVRWFTESDATRFWLAHQPFFEEYVFEILRTNPGVLAFSVNAGGRLISPYFATHIRQYAPHLPILFGGSDCFRSETFTKHMIPGVVDALCPGEGDFALTEMVNAIEREGSIPPHISGWLTWEEGAIRDNGDPERPAALDALAPISLDGVDLARYKLANRITVGLSRGCIRRCSFCSEGPNFFKYRSHSARWLLDQFERLLPEMAEASGEVPHINFSDSLINGNMETLEAMCDGILERQLHFVWGGMAVIRPEMTPDFLTKMREAGCIEIVWGIESGSSRIMQLMRKQITVSLVDQVVRETAVAGLAQYGNIMVGFPGESAFEFAESLLFVAKNKRFFNSLGAPIFTPTKNSTVYKVPNKFGIIEIHNYDWTSDEGRNTYPVRLFRRMVLGELLGEHIFEQGLYREDSEKSPLHDMTMEIRREFVAIHRALIEISREYLRTAGDTTFVFPDPLAGPEMLEGYASRVCAVEAFFEFLTRLSEYLGSRALTLPLLIDRFGDQKAVEKHAPRGSLPVLPADVAVPKGRSCSTGTWMTVNK